MKKTCIRKSLFPAITIAVVMGIISCGTDDLSYSSNTTTENTGTGNGTSSNDGNAPDFDATIYSYDGDLADDASDYVAGTDEDLYWEANDFTEKVYVTYNGTTATVTTSNSSVKYNISNAYVTIDMLTNSVKNVDIIVSGSSSDGQLKIYGEKKFKLTLNGVELTSTIGPAINDQCKKRAFVYLTDGTTNTLEDASTYSSEPYYIDSSTASDEDRKGCFFSEGNLIFSGTGALIVKGNYKHGIVTDGYMYVHKGVTIAVTDAAKNAIHVKGDTDDGIGIYVAGGLIYANTSATAGKGIKTDLNAEIAGGRLMLNTSGGSEYDSDEKDTSSPAGIKTDNDIIISGGTHVIKSTGKGGKGLNSDGAISITGGTTTITTTGGKYTYSSSLTASPKGVKADGDITVSGGCLNISVTGASDGSEGLESKSNLTISGGEVYSYAYDDAINAAGTSSALTISGGNVYAYSINNDGIDSNGSLTISGGLTIGVGTSAPEGGIDCDNSNYFKINGGTVISLGGSLESSPSSSSKQRSVLYNGVSASKGTNVCVLNSSSSPILTFEFPRTMSNAAFFFSTSDITSGASYTVSSGGTITSYTDSWNGWYEGGTWSGGTQVGTFTASSSSIVTTVGSSSSGMGGGGFSGGR